jgi:hypothetical protein
MASVPSAPLGTVFISRIQVCKKVVFPVCRGQHIVILRITGTGGIEKSDAAFIHYFIPYSISGEMARKFDIVLFCSFCVTRAIIEKETP